MTNTIKAGIILAILALLGGGLKFTYDAIYNAGVMAERAEAQANLLDLKNELDNEALILQQVYQTELHKALEDRKAMEQKFNDAVIKLKIRPKEVIRYVKQVEATSDCVSLGSGFTFLWAELKAQYSEFYPTGTERGKTGNSEVGAGGAKTGE